MDKVYTYDPSKKRNILAGYVDGNRFYRKVNARHFMRMLKSYGMQEVVFDDLAGRGVDTVIFKEEHTGDYLISKIEDWDAPDIKSLNYRHGKQKFLPVARMTRTRTL